MRHQGEGVNHLGIGGSLPATCFPTAVTYLLPVVAPAIGNLAANKITQRKL